MVGRRVAVITVAVLAWLVGAGAAQPSDPPEIELEPPALVPPADLPAAPAKDARTARKWRAVGQQLVQKGTYLATRNRPDDAKAQFTNAVAAYRRALDADDDPDVYLELAIAEDKLGKLDDAVRHLRTVVAAGTAVRPEVAKRAAARLESLMSRVGVVTLALTPAGASITLGGVELGTAPLREPLVLLPGTYTLSFQAAGYQPSEVEIKVEPGAELERAIALDPVKVLVAPVKAAPPSPADAGPSRLPLYVGVGLTGAAIASAGVFGGLALREHATFTGAASTAQQRQDARTSGKRMALIADVSLGTAVALAGFTACWYLYKVKPDPDTSPPTPIDTKLSVIPWVQPRSGGVTLAGGF